MEHIGKIDEKEVNRLKALHDELYQLTGTDDEGNTHYLYVKKPDMAALSASARYVDTDPIKSGQLMYNSCKVCGSTKFDTGAEWTMGAMAQIGTLFKAKELELEKL
ncbi:MAG: hypothetical protein Q8L89_09380 [Gammaproteobacteria bacterium]|nr:hypothetical protein [Gammaproteobacteria bacterium]